MKVHLHSRQDSVSQNNKNTVSCNRILVRQAVAKHVGTHFFKVENKVRNNKGPDMLRKIYNHDFTESHHIANKDMVGVSSDFEGRSKTCQ